MPFEPSPTILQYQGALVNPPFSTSTPSEDANHLIRVDREVVSLISSASMPSLEHYRAGQSNMIDNQRGVHQADDSMSHSTLHQRSLVLGFDPLADWDFLRVVHLYTPFVHWSPLYRVLVILSRGHPPSDHPAPEGSVESTGQHRPPSHVSSRGFEGRGLQNVADLEPFGRLDHNEGVSRPVEDDLDVGPTPLEGDGGEGEDVSTMVCKGLPARQQVISIQGQSDIHIVLWERVGVGSGHTGYSSDSPNIHGRDGNAGNGFDPQGVGDRGIEVDQVEQVEGLLPRFTDSTSDGGVAVGDGDAGTRVDAILAKRAKRAKRQVSGHSRYSVMSQR